MPIDRRSWQFTRRAFLPVLTGALSFALDARAQGAHRSRNGSRAFAPARARARHLGRDLHARDGRPETRHLGVRARSATSPSSRSSSGNISTAASPTGASHTGKEKRKEYGALLARIEKDLRRRAAPSCSALWGMESAFGDPVVQKNHLRPVFPSLAALAWGEPRRRAYWEQELINALRIVERGWTTPAEMRGSWAGAMGHTQWMPEVWLNIGMDYDGDGRVSRSASPTTRSRSSARYLINRGKYRRGEHWGYEVRAGRPGGGERPRATRPGRRPASRAPTASPSPPPKATAKLWVPVPGGPAFLLGPNFEAVRATIRR